MQHETSAITVIYRIPPAILISLTIWFLSSMPTVPLPGTTGADKAAHFIAYAALGAACALAHSCTGLGTRPVVLFAAAAALSALYGITDELHQYFVPGRDTSILDWLADLSGSLAGSALMSFVLLRKTFLKKTA